MKNKLLKFPCIYYAIVNLIYTTDDWIGDWNESKLIFDYSFLIT